MKGRHSNAPTDASLLIIGLDLISFDASWYEVDDVVQRPKTWQGERRTKPGTTPHLKPLSRTGENPGGFALPKNRLGRTEGLRSWACAPQCMFDRAT